jgi:hypothetical protein
VWATRRIPYGRYSEFSRLLYADMGRKLWNDSRIVWAPEAVIRYISLIRYDPNLPVNLWTSTLDMQGVIGVHGYSKTPCCINELEKRICNYNHYNINIDYRLCIN